VQLKQGLLNLIKARNNPVLSVTISLFLLLVLFLANIEYIRNYIRKINLYDIHEYRSFYINFFTNCVAAVIVY